MARILI